MAGTAWSRSASVSTTMAFLPPISATTRFTWPWPGWWTAACSMIDRPTAAEPVKVTNETSGRVTSSAPTSSPTPGRKASAPGGTPASSRICTRR